MKNITGILLILSLLYVTPVIAGAGHDHGHSHEAISSTEAEAMATEKVKFLADSGKIDKTWATIKSSTVTQKEFGHGPEWVITFKNDKISDASKQTLYLFFSMDGHYLATNYDGK